jgi:hypothetical protein
MPGSVSGSGGSETNLGLMGRRAADVPKGEVPHNRCAKDDSRPLHALSHLILTAGC